MPIGDNLTKVIRPNLVLTDEVSLREMDRQITASMDSLITRYSRVWDRVRDKRTAGVLLRKGVLAWVESNKRMTWVYKYGVAPFTRRSPAQLATIWAVKEALDRLARLEGSPFT